MSKANDGTANIRMPVGRVAAYKKMISTIGTQLAVIKAHPDYPNEPDLQAAAAALQAELDGLGATVQALANLDVEARALRNQRSNQTASVKRNHDLVVSVVNKLCKGDVGAMGLWGGKPAVRVPADPSVAAPEDVTARSTAEPGTAAARCRSDRTAICYLFQCGTDPSDPESWPPPVIEAGCTHRVTGYAHGTKLYFRIAIQRRRTGQGHWSNIVGVVVR